MEITITHNINLNAPALVDFFREAIAVQTKGNSIVRTPGEVAAARAAAATPVDKAPAFIEKEIAAQNAAALSSDAADLKPARAPRTPKKDAPPPAVAATAAPAVAGTGEFANPESWTKEQKEANLATVRNRLSDYAADKRHGMDGPNGVFAILKKYGVERITALPTDRYAEFKTEIDAALAKPAADPLS